jgi:hypothetical protein
MLSESPLRCANDPQGHREIEHQRNGPRSTVQNESILNVCTSGFNEMCYNFKKHDWFNNFTEENNQAIKEDGVH